MEEENKDYWYVEYTKTKLRLDKTTKELKQQLSEFSDNLDKAKKLLKEFVDWANWQSGGNCPSFKSIQDKAETFLKE